MKRLALFAALVLSVGLLPALAQQPQPKPPAKKDDKTKKTDKKKEVKKDVGLKLNEGDKVVQASVNLVDQQRGLFIVAIPFQGGHKYVEYKINQDTQFFGTDKKPFKEGLGADVFQSPDKRLNLPINLVFDESGNVRAIALDDRPPDGPIVSP